ncbi:MAG: hypothetical protein Q9167_007200 [Letrouitia subvulpina]
MSGKSIEKCLRKRVRRLRLIQGQAKSIADKIERDAYEAKRDADEAKRDADEAKRLAEDAERTADEVERMADEAKRMADEEERLIDENVKYIRDLTLNELLEACFNHLHKRFTVQKNPRFITAGVVNSTGKCCPHELRPWTGFLQMQHDAFDKIYQTLHPRYGDIRAFFSLAFMRDYGKSLDTVISSGADLRWFQRDAVELFVKKVTKHLAEHQAFKKYADLSGGVIFQDHPHTLQDGATEVEAQRQPFLPNHRPRKHMNASQVYVTCGDDTSRLLYVIDYRGPHKLTKEFLQVGLSDILCLHEIRHRLTYPTNKDQKFVEDAEKLIAAAATQTYFSMLEGGLEYSCIVTGEAYVFLKIEKDRPDILYYHLSIPKEDVAKVEAIELSPVAQLLSFSVMACRSIPRDQKWRDEAIARAPRWVMDFDEVERQLQTPRGQRGSPEVSSEFIARKAWSIDRSLYLTRDRRDDSDDDSEYGDESSDDLDNDATDLKSPSQSTSTKGSQGGGPSGKGKGKGKVVTRNMAQFDYCTQACLNGLVRRSAIDESCPNAIYHPRDERSPKLHLLRRRQLRDLLRQQLAVTLDENCINLKIHGLRGLLFQVRLEPHGYTCVAKGTINEFIPDLKNEAQMYHRLKDLQGTSIPVYLGNIDLQRKWYELGIRITHILLISYAGERVAERLDKTMQQQAKDFEAILAGYRICHGDLEPRNMLWNQKLQRVVFIDFERSKIVIPQGDKSPKRRALQAISLNRVPMPSANTAEIKKESTPFTIFDDEITLELPIPSEHQSSPVKSLSAATSASTEDPRTEKR